MCFGLAKVRCAVSGQHQQSPHYIKKNQPPHIETVERALPGARPSRMPTYSLSPAVICVAESAPSAAVAAAASGQTQSVKAG